ncbi:MAG: osmoprotectant transport system permease protein [Methylobacteriaceae bacterium]|jgi:osmoprotectant transport system permease protein|nr:osmoprotectant transport system permease protein [Methylobacteriaceae bacterium]
MSIASLAETRRPSRLLPQDHVALVLALVALPAAFFGGFLSVAPNRLADGQSLTLWHIGFAATAIIFAFLTLVFVAAFIRDKTRHASLLFASGAGLLICLLLIAGIAADGRLDPQEPARRISLASTFWILFSIGVLACFRGLQRATSLWKVALPLGLTAAAVTIIGSGKLNSLSLVHEFYAQRATFKIELIRHVGLVAVAVLLAALCAAPLVLAVAYRPKARVTIFTILNLLQTIPSIALFGLLIAPLSFIAAHVPLAREIGIGGIGAAPALIALVLYGLLPLVRSADAGLRNVPAAVRDSARGMGMTPKEIFRKVDLPLALPALISGLRVVTVQSIGLAIVAALIGAGGLGTFVFQGIGEYALDLVLVGALPTILLALAADALFQIVLANLRSRP